MELWVPKERPTRNVVTGRYLSGHVPHNKGKSWSEYMDETAQSRCKEGWKNLRPRMNIGGWNARPCIAVADDGRWWWFPSVSTAGEKTGIQARNINSVCNKKRKHAGGFRWFFDDDPDLNEIIR